MVHTRASFDTEWDAKWDLLKKRIDAGERTVRAEDATWLGLEPGQSLDHQLGLMYDRQFRTPIEYYRKHVEFWQWSDGGRRIRLIDPGPEATEREARDALDYATELHRTCGTAELMLNRIGRCTSFGRPVFEMADGAECSRTVATVRVPLDEVWKRLRAPVKAPKSGAYEFLSVIEWVDDDLHVGLIDREAGPVGLMLPVELSWVVAAVLRPHLRYSPSLLEAVTGRVDGPRTRVWVLDPDGGSGRCEQYSVRWTRNGPRIGGDEGLEDRAVEDDDVEDDDFEDEAVEEGLPAALVHAWINDQPDVAASVLQPVDPECPWLKPKSGPTGSLLDNLQLPSQDRGSGGEVS